MNRESLPVGKIPAELLGRFLARAPTADSRVILGPGIGLDCAVVESGAKLMVFKSDPVTFVAEEIGYYAVHVNANDIATTGAAPCWMLVTFLLPEAQSTPAMVEELFEQVARGCREIGVTLIGGHSEVTHGLQRPIVAGTMVGEVDRDKLVTPRGAAPGDRLLLTKGVPLEATAVLARELPDRLTMVLDDRELATARNFLADPGISLTPNPFRCLPLPGKSVMLCASTPWPPSPPGRSYWPLRSPTPAPSAAPWQRKEFPVLKSVMSRRVPLPFLTFGGQRWKKFPGRAGMNSPASLKI
ncbi:MAG: AIR synthase related protein [Desulfuromonadales bacterium]